MAIEADTVNKRADEVDYNENAIEIVVHGPRSRQPQIAGMHGLLGWVQVEAACRQPSQTEIARPLAG